MKWKCCSWAFCSCNYNGRDISVFDNGFCHFEWAWCYRAFLLTIFMWLATAPSNEANDEKTEENKEQKKEKEEERRGRKTIFVFFNYTNYLGVTQKFGMTSVIGWLLSLTKYAQALPLAISVLFVCSTPMQISLLLHEHDVCMSPQSALK